MSPPSYGFHWSHDKMLDVMTRLFDYWDLRVGAIKGHLERFAPGDERYLSKTKVLERTLHAAEMRRYESMLFLQEVKDASPLGLESWRVTTADLPWFFPQCAPISE